MQPNLLERFVYIDSTDGFCLVQSLGETFCKKKIYLFDEGVCILCMTSSPSNLLQNCTLCLIKKRFCFSQPSHCHDTILHDRMP